MMKVSDTNNTMSKYSIREKANIFIYYIRMRNHRFADYSYTMYSTGEKVNELYRYCARYFFWIVEYEYYEIRPSYDSQFYDKR